MNRVHTMAFRLLVASLLVLFVFCSRDCRRKRLRRRRSPRSRQTQNRPEESRRIRLLLNRRRRCRLE